MEGALLVVQCWWLVGYCSVLVCMYGTVWLVRWLVVVLYWYACRYLLVVGWCCWLVGGWWLLVVDCWLLVVDWLVGC